MRKPSKQKVAREEAAREEIDHIRRNGFDPGDAVADSLLQKRDPDRAVLIMTAAAHIYRKIVPVH